jgi:cytochrome c-type biogenesis protein CcsB
VKLLLKIVPWLFVALFGAEIIAVMMPKPEGEYHRKEFGRLPVLLNGRIQPFDSVARNSLLQIRSTGDVPLEEVPSWKFWHHPAKLKSTEWLLEVMTRPEVADTRPIFLIHHRELLGELKLQDKGVEKSGLRYYTFDQLKPVISIIEEQSKNAGDVKEEQRNTFQKQVLKLSNAIIIYNRLKFTLQPEGAKNWSRQLATFLKDLGPAREALRSTEAGKELDNQAVRKLADSVQQFQMMASLGYPLTIPPEDPSAAPDAWKTTGASLLETARAGEFPPPVTYLAAIATAYADQNSQQFNLAVENYRKWLEPNYTKELKKGRAEFFYNEVKAFLHATIMYICALVLASIAILTLGSVPLISEIARRSALAIILVAFAVHTFGLIFRMVLEGRPPVTNLYSSAIFIGWGAGLIGILLERIYRVGIGCLVSSFAGFVTLLIAHNLALGGDTMEMLRAVLDTNFWLATHVVVVTLGYAATFGAGLLAIIYIALGVFTPQLKQKLNSSGSGTGLELGKALAKMVYGIVCFATLFSFVGTVLGGIWADQSWGRFWGWDPKENGALMIVIWNALILHARWGGLVRDRGFVNLAVFGNIVTSFSWFGVNMLGIGLHSYGFMDAAFKWLVGFIVCQLAIIGIGLLPLNFWRSFRTSTRTTSPDGPRPGGDHPLPAPARA